MSPIAPAAAFRKLGPASQVPRNVLCISTSSGEFSGLCDEVSCCSWYDWLNVSMP